MSDKLKVLDVTNPRHLEHAEHQDDTIARRGSVPKKCNDGIALHSSVVFSGAQVITASPLASAAPDLKSGKTVAPYPGMRSRTNEGVETHADKVQHGKDMLSTAVYSGGKS